MPADNAGQSARRDDDQEQPIGSGHGIIAGPNMVHVAKVSTAQPSRITNGHMLGSGISGALGFGSSGCVAETRRRMVTRRG